MSSDGVDCISEMELNVNDNQVYISLEPLAIKLLPFNVCNSLCCVQYCVMILNIKIYFTVIIYYLFKIN